MSGGTIPQNLATQTIEIPTAAIPRTVDWEASHVAAATSVPAGIEQSPEGNLLSAKIMIADDDPLTVRVIRRHLGAAGYTNFCFTTESTHVLEQIRSDKPNLVLLDIMMPKQTGVDILKIRNQDETLQRIPFIILCASTEKSVKREALELGANEFLAKPVDPVDLEIRIKNALYVCQYKNSIRIEEEKREEEVQLRLQQLDASCEKIVHCLARAAEFRDNDTGAHVIRVGKYAAVVAAELGFSTSYCRHLELAAQLHDVGKIGIPDSILLKPGKLTKDEFEVMKEHCRVGSHIIEPLSQSRTNIPLRHGFRSLHQLDTPMLSLAANIALTHHEKWDGTGYPTGLQAEQIPIEGRITCVADVYDALNSVRPYKPRFERPKCLEIMLAERGTRFDPQVLDIFFDQLDVIDEIAELHPDRPAGEVS